MGLWHSVSCNGVTQCWLSTTRTSCCAWMITLYGDRNWIQARAFPSPSSLISHYSWRSTNYFTTFPWPESQDYWVNYDIIFYFESSAFLWVVSTFLYISLSVHSSQRLRCTQGQVGFLMNSFTSFCSAGFSAPLNVRLRLNDSTNYTYLMTSILWL